MTASRARTNGQPPERKPLVEIRELAPSDFVEVFGKRYDVIDLDTMSIRERAVIARHFERVLELERKGEDATDEDDAEHTERSRTLIRLVIPSMPDKVVEKIPTGKRGELLGAFLAWATNRSVLMDLIQRMASVSNLPTSPTDTAAARG